MTNGKGKMEFFVTELGDLIHVPRVALGLNVPTMIIIVLIPLETRNAA